MRDLNPAERDIVAGGRDAEFRTFIRNDIPRFDEPPASLQHQLRRFGGSAEIKAWAPLGWLPPPEDPYDFR